MNQNRISTPIQAQGGYYAAQSYQTFEMKNVFDPHPMLGNSAFTTLFFRTESGNVYQIFEKRHENKWRVRNKKTMPDGDLLSPKDLTLPTLSVGDLYYFGEGGRSTRITEIVAVNAGPIRIDHIPNKFNNITEGFTIVN